MPILTALVLASFVAYMASWYFGIVQGSMALLLFMATLVTGLYWLADQFWFKPKRRKAADAFVQAHAAQAASLEQQGIAADNVDVNKTRRKILEQPWWLDWTAGLFPVIVVVFLLRSFAYEPFRIPSGSMIPTLLVGDLILVNKYEWGVRLPITNKKITQGTPIQRGDVIVFRYPPDPKLDYIKRVVGLPGDTVSYLNKRLSINGKAVAYTDMDNFMDTTAMKYFKQNQEQLGTYNHRIITDDKRPAGVPVFPHFPNSENCHYSVEGVTCKVPEGQYFVMGDNRDNSADSRYWGFVPDDNVVGKAVSIWFNPSDLKRIGSIQ